MVTNHTKTSHIIFSSFFSLKRKEAVLLEKNVYCLSWLFGGSIAFTSVNHCVCFVSFQIWLGKSTAHIKAFAKYHLKIFSKIYSQTSSTALLRKMNFECTSIVFEFLIFKLRNWGANIISLTKICHIAIFPLIRTAFQLTMLLKHDEHLKY